MKPALWLATYVSVMTALFLPLWLAGLDQASEAKARARRRAEHRRNARLLRFDI